MNKVCKQQTNQGLKLLNSISWEEAFQKWYKREGTRKEWQEVAKEKGFPDWKSWRESYYKTFNPTKLKWNLYEISLETIPKIFVGPYSSWAKYYKDRDKSTFKNICGKLQGNSKVEDILKNPPKKTEFIGATDGERIILIEGHHRASAIALAEKRNKIINTKCNIVLAKIRKNEFDNLLIKK